MVKPIEDALLKIPNRFLLTTVIARRWESIVAGLPALVETEPGATMMDTVLGEVIEEKIGIDEENHEIVLEGMPEEEENNETLFSSAFSPDAAAVKEIINSGDGN